MPTISPSERNRGMSTTLTTTLLERSAGLCALLVIGTLFAAFEDLRVEGVPLFYVFLVLITLYLLGNFMLFHAWIHRQISWFLEKRNLEQIEASMELVYSGLNALRGVTGVPLCWPCSCPCSFSFSPW